MANLSDPTCALNPGYYGPVTATLDWCEANYQFSHYVAEMANSFSNVFQITLAIFGALQAARQSLPFRYIFGYAGIALVGVGSFAFHATLLFQAQLADELPMIYVGSMSLWLLFDDRPGFSWHSRTKYLAAISVLLDLIFTLTYFYNRNPIYHQIVFATIVWIVGFRVTYLLQWSEHSLRIPDKKKSIIGKLFGRGAGMFALGFFIWNMDNIYCDTLTHWKVFIGWPRAFLLEGHSWWHVLTGAGTYYMFIGIQYFTLCAKDDQRNYTLGYKLGLPHVTHIQKH